jgi:DNA-binding PadR family transcriptional regulator
MSDHIDESRRRMRRRMRDNLVDELRGERGPVRAPHRRGPGPGFGPGFGQGFGAGFGQGFGQGGPGFGPGMPPMPPMPPGPRGRGRRGARRGDVRAAVLALLAERPMHGYEVIQQIEERSGGRWRPSPGSIYPTLQLLADEGLVSGDESGGRRLFTLTSEGEAEAGRHTAGAPWEQQGDDPEWDAVRQVMDELGQLGMAVRQVVAVGTPEQRAEILGAIADVRRRAYGLLAETPSAATGPAPAADAGDELDDEPPAPATPPTPPVPPTP